MSTVPAARMKANREHRVPLCRRALEILDAAGTLSGVGGPLVFTIDGGEPRGKRRDVPAHHRAAEALDKYVEAAELEEPKAALF